MKKPTPNKTMKKPTDEEILSKRYKAASAANMPPRFPGMTYAEGVLDALDWVMGDLEGDLEV